MAAGDTLSQPGTMREFGTRTAAVLAMTGVLLAGCGRGGEQSSPEEIGSEPVAAAPELGEAVSEATGVEAQANQADTEAEPSSKHTFRNICDYTDDNTFERLLGVADHPLKGTKLDYGEQACIEYPDWGTGARANFKLDRTGLGTVGGTVHIGVYDMEEVAEEGVSDIDWDANIYGTWHEIDDWYDQLGLPFSEQEAGDYTVFATDHDMAAVNDTEGYMVRVTRLPEGDDDRMPFTSGGEVAGDYLDDLLSVADSVMEPPLQPVAAGESAGGSVAAESLDDTGTDIESGDPAQEIQEPNDNQEAVAPEEDYFQYPDELPHLNPGDQFMDIDTGIIWEGQENGPPIMIGQEGA